MNSEPESGKSIGDRQGSRPSRCFRSVESGGMCKVCGHEARIMHWPGMRFKGCYCSEHCPVCNPAARSKGEAAGAVALDSEIK